MRKERDLSALVSLGKQRALYGLLGLPVDPGNGRFSRSVVRAVDWMFNRLHGFEEVTALESGIVGQAMKMREGLGVIRNLP